MTGRQVTPPPDMAVKGFSRESFCGIQARGNADLTAPLYYVFYIYVANPSNGGVFGLMKRLTTLFSLLALSFAFAADTPLESFVGLTIGQSHKEIAGRISKRENLVGPGKGIFDDAGKLTAKTFRYTGSFNRDRNIDSVMLYFSTKGTLAGMDVFIKRRTTFERYGRDLARLFKTTSAKQYKGKVSAGTYAGSEITYELVTNDARKSKYRSYIIQVRCPDVLRKENISKDQAEREAAGSGSSKSSAADYLKRAL